MPLGLRGLLNIKLGKQPITRFKNGLKIVQTETISPVIIFEYILTVFFNVIAMHTMVYSCLLYIKCENKL